MLRLPGLEFAIVGLEPEHRATFLRQQPVALLDAGTERFEDIDGGHYLSFPKR